MRQATIVFLAAVCAIAFGSFFDAPVHAQAPPGPLERFVGTFDVGTKLYMQPGQPPMQTKAAATFREIMNGRFVQQDYKDGQFGIEGVGYFGYDPRTKLYSSVWMYNMSPKIEYSTGTLDDKGVLTLKGEGREFQHSWPDADTRVLKSWALKGDKKSLLYEITYKRKK